MKRILIFSTNYFPWVGGAEIAIKEITDRLSEDFEFDLVTIRFSRDVPAHEEVGKVNVYRVGLGLPSAFEKSMGPFLAAAKALSLSRARRYDCFWAVMVTYASAGAYLANLMQLRDRTPIILTLQEGLSEEEIAGRYRGLLALSWRLALKNTSLVTTISTYLERLARTYGYESRIELIPNAVNTEHFSQSFPEEDVDALRKKLGKKAGDTHLITTSRLAHKNAVDVVIRSLPLLESNVHFVILGTGPDEEALRKLADELGVADRVRFLGHVDHEEMPKYLRAADIFIRPSRSEGMGNSFVEAMAAGIPVIATQEGGIADFLFDERRNPEREPTGFAVDKDSAEQIAEAVRTIAAHPEKVRKIVETARRLAFEKYDWNLIAQDMRTRAFDSAMS